MSLQPYVANRSDGFTLIEVIAALGLLAVGVLGMQAFQQHALRASFDALSDTRARYLLQEIAERVHAGGGMDYAIAFGTPTPVPAGDCRRQSCSAEALAQWDISEWRSKVEDSTYLPAGKGELRFDPERGLYTAILRFGSPVRELSLQFGR